MKYSLENLEELLANMNSYLDVTMALVTLDDITAILNKMEALAERAAQESCTDKERMVLQKEMESHIAKINSIFDKYETAVRDNRKGDT